MDEKLENLTLENNKKPYKLGRRRRRTDSIDDDNDSQRSSNQEENLNDDDDEEDGDVEDIIPLERESGDGEVKKFIRFFRQYFYRNGKNF